jgi:nucleoside-diphosphate-sugar epimerase
MKKMLIVGGAGYVGGAFTTKLQKSEQYDFTVYDELFYEDRYLKNVSFIRGDIRDTAKLLEIARNYEVVVWLAALVGDPLCALNSELTFEINTHSLERFSSHYEGKIVFMSTCSVYGAQDGLLNESSATNPLSLYAETKLLSETILLNKKPESLVLRLGTLFGISDEFARLRADLVLNVLVMRAVYAGELTVFGGNQFRPLLHVKDVASAIISGLKVNASGVYNVHNENITIVQLAEKIQNYDPNVNIEVTEQTFQDSRNYSVSSEKAKKDFGFTPEFNTEYGIKEVYVTLKDGRFPRILDQNYSNVDKMREFFTKIKNPIMDEYFKGVY